MRLLFIAAIAVIGIAAATALDMGLHAQATAPIRAEVNPDNFREIRHSNNIRIYRFQDGPFTCYVANNSTEFDYSQRNPSISCVK